MGCLCGADRGGVVRSWALSTHLAFQNQVFPEGEDHDPAEEVDSSEHAQDGEGGDILTVVQTQLGCAK